MPLLALTPPQTRFRNVYLAPTAVFTLFVGGFGSGKTETLVAGVFEDLFGFPGANVGVYSPTYDLIRLILLPRFEAYLDLMKIPYQMNKTEWILTVQGYGDIIFRSLDRPGRIIGYEHFSAHIDEIDTLQLVKAEGAWLKVLGRNRQVVKGFEGYVNRIGLYTTPEGFNFTHRYFSKDGEKYRKMSPEAKRMYRYVRAPTYSNPHLPPGYVDTLRATYPEHLINAYIEGRWVNLNSGRVYPGFDKLLNACTTRETETEDILIGMDFNVQRGCSTAHVIRPGPYGDEAHAIFEVHNAYDTPAQIRILKERFDIKKHKLIVYPDASGKQRKSVNASASDFSALEDAGFHVKKYNYNGSIKDRVASFNSMICNGNNQRRYKINVDECPYLVAGLETQVYDAYGLPEKGPGKWDDINDGPGYFVVRRWPLTKPKMNKMSVVGHY